MLLGPPSSLNLAAGFSVSENRLAGMW